MENIDAIIIPAARKGENEVILELIKRGVDLNVRDEKGYTPLIIACYNNRIETARLLLENGASIDVGDNGGNTALMGASFKGYLDIVELLVSRNAALDLQHGNGGTALMFAGIFGRNDVFEFLLRSGANPWVTDIRGQSVADLLAMQGNEKAIEILKLYAPEKPHLG